MKIGAFFLDFIILFSIYKKLFTITKIFFSQNEFQISKSNTFAVF